MSITNMDVLPLEEPTKVDDQYELEMLATTDQLYNQVTSDFQETNWTVQSIEKVKNHNCWRGYTDKRNQILNRKPQHADFKLNETYLYHGTRADKVTLCQEGFDVNFTSDGQFGKGIYFSDSPMKCGKYADNIIFVARVILGTTKVYPEGKKDTTLVREPKKENPSKGEWSYYDSVKGRPRDHTEYVIYRNECALIEYVVTFTKTGGKSSTKTEDAPTKTCQPESGDVTDEPLSDNDDFTSANEDYTSSSSDDDEEQNKDAANEDYTSSSSDDDEEQNKDSRDDDTEGQTEQSGEFTEQSGTPFFTIMEGELSLDQKKAEYKRITLTEEEDSEIDKMMEKTDEDLERAIYLYFAYKQVKEEEARKEAGEFVEAPIEDDGSPIFPPMEPGYESELWKNLSEEDQKKKTDKMIMDFLDFTSLEEKHRHIATRYVSDAKYNLDDALVNYYKSCLC